MILVNKLNYLLSRIVNENLTKGVIPYTIKNGKGNVKTNHTTNNEKKTQKEHYIH